MKFYVFTGAANMRRAELVHHQLFDLGHELVQPWQECYQVDRAALAAADGVIILLVEGTDAAELLRCALLEQKPVLLWREPSGRRLHLELETHKLVMRLDGDLAERTQQQALAVAAVGMLIDEREGAFERQRYGGAHARRIADAIQRRSTS
jgi:hypothetical protein